MQKREKREIDLLVISDIHLGSFGSKAKEVINYLKTVQPKILVLNGDIIDIWQFNKKYFPKSHLKVIKYLTSLVHKGTPIYYVTGNHDEMLRRFKGLKVGNFEIVNKVVLDLDDKKAWIFHGDVFDVSMQHSKWLAKLGGKGYEALLLLNNFVNYVRKKFGFTRISFSKKIKDSVKGAVKHINNFETTVTNLAINKKYDYVVCGHIHHPKIERYTNKNGSVLYLNSGDWVENMTALEYHQGQWSIYSYNEDLIARGVTENEVNNDTELVAADYDYDQLMDQLIIEIDTK